ncbi:hypothetical protein ACN4EG_08620 [Alkalinema pantanalense CENA528]|uniref:hypothetical protein n=1 Tax=Alkalinema pantanalense TaxID=1620705 RepID=UPI003D6F53DE
MDNLSIRQLYRFRSGLIFLAIAFAITAIISGFYILTKTPLVSVDAPSFFKLSFNFSLFGSLFSFGGAIVVTQNIQLRQFKQRIILHEQCPFLVVYQPSQIPSLQKHRPGNPFVCVKCPLGLDLTGDRASGLIHACKVYEQLHDEWEISQANASSN